MKNPVIFSTTFETYTAIEIIGEGGSARVFKATDEGGQPVAVKLFDPSKATKDKVKRFKNEYLFCVNNRHPNVVTVVDHGILTHGGKLSPFVVMPLYDGSLRELIQAGITPDEVLRYFAQLMDGMECAHLKNVVHRDLKPENVLYDQKSNQLLLADFGIARFGEDELFTAVKTGDNDRLANFQYAAPEQRRRGANVDLRADIYSSGLILNEMFTGEVPYGTEYKTIETVSSEHSYLDDIVSQMIRQAPEDRPVSIEKVKHLLIAHKNEFITRQRISELTQTVVPVEVSDDVLIDDPVRLVDFDWNRGRLTLILNHPVNDLWVWALQNMGGHSSMMGYGPERFAFRGDTTMIDCIERDVQQMINYFKGWLPNANRVYKARVESDLQKSEQARKLDLQQELAVEEARQRVLRDVKI